MTLHELLERAHCCPELLEFAAQTEARTQKLFPGYVLTFAGLWNSIEARHDWLTWLMRHCPDQFEDSWRDAVSALHALGDAYDTDHWEAVWSAHRTCGLIRSYIRLRK